MDNYFSSFDLLSEFLKERITHPNYNVLPPEALSLIQGFTEEDSLELWKKYVHPIYTHYREIDMYAGLNDPQAIRGIKIDFENEEETSKLLDKMVSISGESQILIFSAAKEAIITKWHVFLKYWSDFCYPAEINIIIFLDTSKAIEFDNREFSIVDRFAEFWSCSL
jgi:Protein of unknown function (DUF2947)